MVRYAVRLPAGAELRFTPELHPQARASAGAVSFRVTWNGPSGGERELFARVVRAYRAQPARGGAAPPRREGDALRAGGAARAGLARA